MRSLSKRMAVAMVVAIGVLVSLPTQASGQRIATIGRVPTAVRTSNGGLLEGRARVLGQPLRSVRERRESGELGPGLFSGGRPLFDGVRSRMSTWRWR